MSVPETLQKNLNWYIENQKDLAAKYSGKILLIVDQKLVRVFDDMTQAYTEASKSYQPNTYTLQECSGDADSYSMVLYNPMFAHVE